MRRGLGTCEGLKPLTVSPLVLAKHCTKLGPCVGADVVERPEDALAVSMVRAAGVVGPRNLGFLTHHPD